MLKASHIQEMKRRYAEMHAPLIEEEVEEIAQKVVEEQLDEHCGVCGEGEGIEEDHDCDEVHPDMSHDEWEKEQKEEVEIEEGAKFSASQINKLKTEYSKLQKIDPESPAYKKMKTALGKMSKEQLKQIKDAKIKFLQYTAGDLLRKMGEEVEIDEEVFYWYIIKGTTQKGKVWRTGTEREMKLLLRKPTTPSGYVLAKSRKDLSSGDVWKGSMGVSEEVEIEEEVTEKDYDSLKRGDTVTIEYKGGMSSGKGTFKVTAKNIVGKAKVGKVTLQNVKNPRGVKYFLYKRGNKVSFAIGDMGASVVSYTKEEVEVNEGISLQVKMALDDVGLKGTWKNGKVYVKKRDVKKAEKALK